MEIAWDSVDLEESFHSTASLGVNIFDDFVELFLVGQMIVFVLLLLWKSDFFEIIHDVHQVDFEDVFDIKGEEGAWVASELDIDVHFQFLGQVLLVNYQVAFYLRHRELYH
jgi:hypothetical protein